MINSFLLWPGCGNIQAINMLWVLSTGICFSKLRCSICEVLGFLSIICTHPQGEGTTLSLFMNKVMCVKLSWLNQGNRAPLKVLGNVSLVRLAHYAHLFS